MNKLHRLFILQLRAQLIKRLKNTDHPKLKDIYSDLIQTINHHFPGADKVVNNGRII